MSPTQRRYLILAHVIGSALFNLLLAAASGWVLFRGLARVPLWGVMSIAGDTISTSVMLPFMTTVMVTAVVRRDVRKGRVDRLGWTHKEHALLARLPRATLSRALVLAAAGAVLFAPATLLCVHALGVAPLGLVPFVAFKAGFAAVAAALFTPVIALFAMTADVAQPAPAVAAR